jgi:NAD(P)H-hydrate epimerase
LGHSPTEVIAMNCQLRPLSRREVRELDVQAAEQLGLPSLILMENAGRGAAAWLAELSARVTPESASRPFSAKALDRNGHLGEPALPRVLILSGSGNNGGDGGVVARHLDAWGFAVRIVWFAYREHLRGDAKTQWMILERSRIDQTAWLDSRSEDPGQAELDSLLADADWLVDGLLGTGLSRPVEGVLKTVIEAMNRSGKPILALDLPSGMDADTGMPLGVVVTARATATFVAAKLGFGAAGAAAHTGEVAVIDIGLPRALLEPFLA